MCTDDCCLALIAVFIPPLAVCLKRGCCTADLVINIALTLLGAVPGIIHAWWVIFNQPDDRRRVRPGYESGPSRIIIVGQAPRTYVRQQQKINQGYATYGSTAANRPVYVHDGYEPVPAPSLGPQQPARGLPQQQQQQASQRLQIEQAPVAGSSSRPGAQSSVPHAASNAQISRPQTPQPTAPRIQEIVEPPPKYEEVDPKFI